MRRTYSGVYVCLALTLAVLFLPPGISLARSQGPDEPPPITEQPPAPPPAAQAPQATPAAPPAPVDVRSLWGSCQSGVNTVMLSQPFMPRFSELQWWAVGFAAGSTVGVQVTDPSGRSTQLGS